jgi:hypothetical protein
VTSAVDTSNLDDRFPRALWWHIEMVHAVTYFASESRQAAEALGLKGFWRSYFGFRAAPLGRCTAGVVEAAFFGFSPTMVRQAIPDVWERATPESLVTARAAAAAVALRRVAPFVDQTAAEVTTVLENAIARGGAAGGRALFAANRDVAPFADPIARLWQACTTLREHRGDGHVAAWVSAGMSAPDVAVLFVADNAMPDAVLQPNRGWTDEEWWGARRSLIERGLLSDLGVTEHGRALRREIESTTDRVAAERFAAIGSELRREILQSLAVSAHAVAASGLIPFPNPMGLPREPDAG